MGKTCLTTGTQKKKEPSAFYHPCFACTSGVSTPGSETCGRAVVVPVLIEIHAGLRSRGPGIGLRGHRGYADSSGRWRRFCSHSPTPPLRVLELGDFRLTRCSEKTPFRRQVAFRVIRCRVSLENLFSSVREDCHSSPKDNRDVFLGLAEVGGFVTS